MNDKDRPIFTIDTMRAAMDLKESYRRKLEIARSALEWIAGQCDVCCVNACESETFAHKARETLRKIA